MTQYNPYDTPTPFTSVDPATPTPTTPPTPTPTPTTPPPTPTPTTPPKYKNPDYTGPGKVIITIIDPSEINEKDPKKRTKDKTISTTDMTVPWTIKVGKENYIIKQLNPTIIERPGLEVGDDPIIRDFDDRDITIKKPTYGFGEPPPPQEQIDAWDKQAELIRLQILMREWMIRNVDPSITDPDDPRYRVGTVATPPDPNAPKPPLSPKDLYDQQIKDADIKRANYFREQIKGINVNIFARLAEREKLLQELEQKIVEQRECKNTWGDFILPIDYCSSILGRIKSINKRMATIDRDNAADSKEIQLIQDKLNKLAA